jgi:hypothetical protein
MAGTKRSDSRSVARKSRRGYLWVTLSLFLASIAGHWTFAWFAYVNEAEAHAQPVRFEEYAVEVGRDTLENWQSEFLQLIWQVAGLAFLLYVGSPQSKEGTERVEAKIDYLLSQTGEGDKERRRLNTLYQKEGD